MNEEGVPIRPPAVAELEVDSTDRYTNQRTPLSIFQNPSTSSVIEFQSRQALLSGYFTRIAVSDLLFQWKTPNINPRNNTFAVQIVGGPVLICQLTTGFYDLSGLATAMVNEMNVQAGSNIFVASLVNLTSTNPDARGILILNTTPSTFFFVVTIPSDLQFYKTAGIEVINTVARNPQIFALTTDLAYTHYVDIVSNRLSKFSKVKDAMTRQKNGLTNVLARVFLTPFNTQERFIGTTPFNFAVDYTTPKHLRWNPEEYLYDFDLTLYDEYGEVLYWDPLWSSEYQLTIQASET